jgi:hypothetical protein
MNYKLNFFEVLSAGDKELVHSSMIKLLLENQLTQKELLNLFSIEKKIDNLKIEKEKKIEKNRYDLYFKFSDESECVIENKFKAIPTFEQIERYKREKRKIILLVFSADFITGFNDSVDSNFKILSYLSFSNNNTSILSFLNDFIKEQEENFLEPNTSDFMILTRHYRDYLSGFRERIQPAIISDKICFKEILKGNDVFILRNYLFHLQAEIINLLAANKNELSKFWKPNNDGGSNTNPCVSFFGPKNESKNGIGFLGPEGYNQFFIEFQGASFKAGLLFSVTNFDILAANKIKNIKRSMIKAVKNHQNDFEVLFKDNLELLEHEKLRKIKENKSSSSSMAFKFDFSNASVNKQSLLSDIVKMMEFLKLVNNY